MFRFRSSQPTTSDTSAFIGPEAISDVMLNEMMFESADQHVFQTMMDSMCAMYQATACGDMSIAREGLGDMAKSAWEWFKSIIKKIADFIKNAFNYLMSYVLDFEKFIDKYKENVNNFQEFEVSGYTYTIDGEPIDNYGVDKIVTQYNTNIDKIKDKETSEVQAMIREELGKESIGEMRAKLCGKTGIIKPDKFVKEMEKKFRNGKGSKSTIKVNSGLVSGYIDEFKRYKELLADVKEDGYNVQSVLTDMGEFFRGMPTYDYKDSNDKRIKKYKISADAKKGEVKTDEDGDESYSTDTYKKLTMYYNFCYRMCRDIAGVYTKAYTVKIAALKEAVSFYKSVIRRALSPFADKVKDKAESAVSSTKESVTIVQETHTDWMTEMGLNSFKGEELSTHERIRAFNELKSVVKTSNTNFESEIKYGGENSVAVFSAVGRGNAEKDAQAAVKLANAKSKEFVFSIPKQNFFTKGIITHFVWVYAKHKNKVKLNENFVIVDTIDETEDYSLTAMEAMHEIEISEWDAYYEEYISEINIMAEAYRRGCVLMEDVEVKEKTGPDAKESVFKKIIEFIRTIIAKFMDKASNLFNSNQEWFDKYSGKLDNVPAEAYDNIRITMLSYHHPNNDYKLPLPSPDDAKNPKYTDPKIKTIDDLAKVMYPQICRLSATKDVVEGTKIWFRGKSNKVETYQDSSRVKEMVVMMSEWCKNYNEICQGIKDEIDKLTNQMEDADKAYESSKESSTSYLLGEDALVENTGFAWLPWVDSKNNPQFLILTEADGKPELKEKDRPQDTVGAAAADDSTVKAGDNDAAKKKVQEEEEAKKKEKEENTRKLLNIKYFWQVKVRVATAMLTIAEERFVNYIKTLRNVVALAKIAADKSDNPDKKK